MSMEARITVARNTLWKSVLTNYHTQEFVSNGSCIGFPQWYQIYHLAESIDARHNHRVSFILRQLRYEVDVDLLLRLVWYR